MPIRIAVVADSHFHPPGVPTQAAWASDARFNARNAAAVAMVNRVSPALVVHLGDVPHPIPDLPEHDLALDVAGQTYEALRAPLLVVPGNHDVGDKPQPWAPAPKVNEARHARFSRRWGPPWWVRELGGVRLVGIDTPVLDSGNAIEAEQWAFLDELVRPDQPRTFAFLHYPPFLLDPGEAEHYDNLSESARARLIAWFSAAGVEAVLCGHVHHPFWNHHRGIDYYLLPSTAFVRPAFSELSRVGPGDEYGRNDTDRLGFCVLDIGERGHHLSWVRTGGAEAPQTAPEPVLGPLDCPLGLTLRHAWDAVQDVAVDGLDPYRRKWARNDLVLLAAWELGVRLLRVPMEDLRNDATRARMLALARHGLSFVVFAVGALSPADRARLAEARPAVRALELVLPRSALAQPPPAVEVPRWFAPLGRTAGEAPKGYFDHFVPFGFTPDDPDLALLPEAAPGDGAVFRVEGRAEVAAEVAAVSAAAARVGRRAVALVHLPRLAEGREQADDALVTECVLAAFRAAEAHPDVTVILDTAMDHDRGYFPRRGLLDRRGNPRPAFYALRQLASERSRS